MPRRGESEQFLASNYTTKKKKKEQSQSPIRYSLIDGTYELDGTATGAYARTPLHARRATEVRGGLPEPIHGFVVNTFCRHRRDFRTCDDPGADPRKYVPLGYPLA